jgi:uncharacterized membrane protein YeaQ/YmgE (transglycosylase-associated protein family)
VNPLPVSTARRSCEIESISTGSPAMLSYSPTSADSATSGVFQPAQREPTPTQDANKEVRRVGIIGWIILGLLAGAIAKLILPGDQPGGFIVTTIVGIVGALIAGFIAQALGFGDPIDEFFDLSTWVAAIIGAIVLLLIWQWIANRRTGRRTFA